LPSYVQRLEKRFDPELDFVFRANCISQGDANYPQGGSGYVLSRAAVRTMAPYGRYFMCTSSKPEDISFEALLIKLGVHIFDTTDDVLVGHFFGQGPINNLISHNYSAFPDCPTPEDRPPNTCRSFLAPLRKITFCHKWGADNADPFNNSRAVFAADPTIRWWMYPYETTPQLCRWA
jgi:hypothetical protein